MLGYVILGSVCDVNKFKELSNYTHQTGSPNLYLRVIDMISKTEGYMRFIPPVGASVIITLVNIDDSKVIRRVASIPFADDRSILRIDMMPDDVIGYNSIKADITIGGRTIELYPLTTVVGGLKSHTMR